MTEPQRQDAARTRTPGARIRALLDRATDPVTKALIEEMVALEDRVCYGEAATAHIIDAVNIDPHELPDPHVPQVSLPPVDGEIPF